MGDNSEEITFRDILLSYDIAYINNAIEHYGNNKKLTARKIGLSRNGLYEKLDLQFKDLRFDVVYDPDLSFKEASQKFKRRILEDVVKSLKERRIMVE